MTVSDEMFRAQGQALDELADLLAEAEYKLGAVLYVARELWEDDPILSGRIAAVRILEALEVEERPDWMEDDDD